MSGVTVYTANIGQHDNLRPPGRPAFGSRFLCYQDEPLLAPAPWITIPSYTAVPGDAARNVRVHKLLPHEFARLEDDPSETDVSIWHDANFVLTMNPLDAVARFLVDGADIALFRHPGRDCLYAEAECCASENIENRDVLERQVARYRADGFPAHWGLAACGVLIRRHSEKMRAFSIAWWREVLEHGRRDQIAFPYLAAKHELKIAWIPGDIFNNDVFKFHYHAAWDRESNASFKARNLERRDRWDRLKALCGPSNAD